MNPPIKALEIEVRNDVPVFAERRPNRRRGSLANIPVKLPLSAIKRPVLIACMFAILAVIGGCIGLFHAYVGKRTFQAERPVVQFVLVVFFTVFVFVCYVFHTFWKAFTTGLIRIPFDYAFIEQKSNPIRSMYDVFHSHGKYYLRRLYGVEILESLYQIYNFGLFACRMSTGWLFMYCAVLASAASFQLYQIRNVHKAINNEGKNRENLMDIFLELFCTSGPLCIIYFGHNIYFSENETIQIISVPLFAFIGKVLQVLDDEICVAVDVARLQRDLATSTATNNLPPSQRRQQPRMSLAIREQALIARQNEYLGPIWRKGMLFFFGLIASFWGLLACVQFANFFIVEPDHFVYCKINVPSCSYWVYPKNNCLKIVHLRTTGIPSDPILGKFTESDAAVTVKVSDLQKFKLFNQFPNLRRITIFKSNVTNIDIDWGKFPELLVVNLAGFPHARRAHSSFYKNKVSIITYADMPNLQLQEDFDLPEAKALELIRVGKTVPKINGDEINSLALVDYGIYTLPKGIKDVDVFTTLKLSGNNFTEMKKPTRFLVDLRGNRIKEFPPTLAKHNYGHGNPVPCPDGWKCEEDTFCHPKCTNAYHEREDDAKACTLDCVLYCGIGKCEDFIE